MRLFHWGGAAVAGWLLTTAPAEGQVTRLNLRPDGTQSGSGNYWEQATDVSASDDGRFVAFISTFDDLVADDTNDAADAFLLDRLSGEIRLITRGYDGAPAHTTAPAPETVSQLRISGDGNTLVFVAAFANLVPGDTNDANDIFVHDRASATTTRLSVGAGGQQSSGSWPPHVASPDVSHDGSVIVYTATSLVLTGLPDYEVGTVLVDRVAGTATTIAFGATSPYASRARQVAVSGNGRVIAATSVAALLPSDTNDTNDVYVFDRDTDTFEQVSVTSAGLQSTAGGVAGSRRPSLSHDGRFVTFESDSATLAPPPGAPGGYFPTQVFLRDRSLGTTIRVSETAAGMGGTTDSTGARISPDGSTVAFLTDSPDSFVPVRYSGRDALVWSRETRTFRTVNIPRNHMPAASAAVTTVWPTAGDDVLFASSQANLVDADTNASPDIFVRSMTQPEPTITAMTPDIGPRDTAMEVVITGTGFVPGATGVFVSAGGLHPLAPTSISATSLTVTIPGGQGVRTVSVATPSGIAATTYTSGSCGFTVAPTRLLVPTTGGTYPLAIVPVPGSDADCPWMATTNLPSTIDGTTFLMGTGGATLTLDVPGHPGEHMRDLTVNAAGVRIDITQAGTRGVPVSTTVGETPVTATIPVAAGDALVTFRNVTYPHIVALFEGTFDPNTRIPRPAGFRFLPARAFSLNAGILFGSASVCVPFLDTDMGESVVYPDGLCLFRWSPNQYTWRDVTTGVDAVARHVCGDTTTLGEFALAYAETTRYLAEGATSSFFDTQLALLNPGNADASAALTFLRNGQQPPITHLVNLPARTRTTVDVKNIPGLEAAEFSTVVYADRFLVVDRTMRWDGDGYGAHAETATAAPSPIWYLAEGATHSGFALFYLLQNPAGMAGGHPRPLPAAEWGSARENLYAGAELAHEHLGERRALRWPRPGAGVHRCERRDRVARRHTHHRRAGDVSVEPGTGVQCRAREHGRHGAGEAVVPRGGRRRATYFDMFILIANPTAEDAEVQLVPTCWSAGGTYIRHMVGTGQLALDHLGGRGDDSRAYLGRPLADAAVSTDGGDRPTASPSSWNARCGGPATDELARSTQLGRSTATGTQLGRGRRRGRRPVRYGYLPADLEQLGP